MKTSFALTRVGRPGEPREVRVGVCAACHGVADGRWGCGRRATLRDLQAGVIRADQPCPTCRNTRELLDAHPDRQVIIDDLGLLPHSDGAYYHCGTRGHLTKVVDYEAAAHGYLCSTCWKMRQSAGWKTAPGEVLHVDRPLPTSAVEAKSREYLSTRHDVADPAVANAVCIKGDLYGRGEVTPDILIPARRLAVEIDSPGRDGTGHRGARQAADEAKDRALARVGWAVIRVRLGGLDPLPSASANVICAKSLTRRGLDELDEPIRAREPRA